MGMNEVRMLGITEIGDYGTPKVYCDRWPDGCKVCDLLLCDGSEETARRNAAYFKRTAYMKESDE